MIIDEVMEDRESSTSYLLEGANNCNRDKAIENLQMVKEQEATKKLIPVWVDATTTKLVDMDKVKERKMELIRVKMGKGELVWMERKTAIKYGYING